METNDNGAVAGIPEASPPGASRSIWSIMAGVFTAPAQAFTDFKPKPRILIPIIIIVVVASVAAVLLAEQSAMLQYEMMRDSTTLPQQALDQMRESAESPNYINSAIFGPVPIIIITVLSALLAWFLGSFVFGGEAKFKQIWGVELLAMLIAQLGGLVKVPLVLAKGSMHVSLGLAAVYPNQAFTSIVYMFLYYLDIFAIWSLVVTGIGYSVIFGISRGKGYTMSIIITVLFSLLGIGLTAFGMGFAGVEMTFF